MSNNKKRKKPLIYYYIVTLLIVMLSNVFLFPSMKSSRTKEVNYNTFISMLNKKGYYTKYCCSGHVKNPRIYELTKDNNTLILSFTCFHRML